MHISYPAYMVKTMKDALTALSNIALFLPYYFSVPRLLMTLFKPWKRIVTVKKTRGFSFSEWSGRLSFNLISRMMGAIIRSSVLITYLILQSFFVISIPFIFIGILFLSPLSYLVYLIIPTDTDKINDKRKQFIETRTLENTHSRIVGEWFDHIIAPKVTKKPWWSIHVLLSHVPIGRDWAMGYTPTLDDYSEELTKEKEHYRHLVGRKDEINELQLFLSKEHNSSIILIGEDGIGKHALVETLAKRIYEGKSNSLLSYKRVLRLKMDKILSEAENEHKQKELLATLFDEAKSAGNIILVIDHIDLYTSNSAHREDLSDMFDRYIRQGVQFIGVTSPYLYQKFIYNNSLIEKTFTPLNVYEITPQEALSALLEYAPDIEIRYDVIIPYETLLEIVNKSRYFITHIPFPEKAIALLDDTSAFVREYLKHEKIRTVLPEHVDIVLSQKTHAPVTLNQPLKQKLITLETELKKKIFLQDSAIKTIAQSIRTAYIKLGERQKPLASLLFLGSTGVGKTQTAKELAIILFNDPSCMIRLDMEYYQTQKDIDKLIGSTENDTPGILTQALRQHPHAILLIDEIEKADRNILNMFLTLLDEGYVIDGRSGKHVDAKNCIIIATSNAGATELANHPNITEKEFITMLIDHRMFTPELLNRFDGIVVFSPITKTGALTIAKQICESLANDIKRKKQIDISLSNEELSTLVEHEYNPSFGIRDLTRSIQQALDEKTSQYILSEQATN